MAARFKYQAERPATAAVAGILATYGEDDPDWMGSHVYRDTAGYYDILRPSSCASKPRFAPPFCFLAAFFFLANAYPLIRTLDVCER